MLKVQRKSSILYNKNLYDYPIDLNKNTIKNLGIVTMIEIAVSYFVSAIHKRQEKSLEDFYINRFGKKLYLIFFKDYTKKVWGVEPDLISPDWGKQRVKGLSIKEILKNIFFKKSNETSLIKEFKYPRLGPGQLWEIAGDKFISMGGTIKKSCKVVKLHKKDNKIYKVDYLQDEEKKELEGDIFISSMPLRDMVLGLNDDVPLVNKIASGLKYRDFVTAGVLIEKKDITFKGNDISDCWIYIQEKELKLGRIQIYNNWSSYLVNNNEKYIWLGLEYCCVENDEYWNLNEKHWLELAANDLIQLNIISSKLQVKDFHVIKVKKAYPSYVGTYNQINEVISYLNKYKNLYCIGRNGQHHYNNMDHSMLTAFEAAKNIQNKKETKENIWGVNTKREYHERVKGKNYEKN